MLHLRIKEGHKTTYNIDAEFSFMKIRDLPLVRYFISVIDKGEYREEGKLIIITSHHREDIEDLCDYVYKMDDGKITESIRCA